MIDLDSDTRYRNLTPSARARVVFAFESDDNKPGPEYWEFGRRPLVVDEDELFRSTDREPLHARPAPPRKPIPLPPEEGPDVAFAPGQSDTEACARWTPDLQQFYDDYNAIQFNRSQASPLDKDGKRKPTSAIRIDVDGYGEGPAADTRFDRHVRDFYRTIAIERRTYNDERVCSILRNGYVHIESYIGSTKIPTFCEKGDRTLMALVLRMFAASFCDRVTAGPSKNSTKPQPNKRLGFLEPYIELDGPFWRMIVVDLDRTFASMEEARKYFGYRVRQRKLPCMPSFIVAARTEDGSVQNPHVYFLLNWSDGVSTDGRRNDRERLLFSAIERALIRGCGGDWGAAGGIRRKNPLSPIMSVGIFNQVEFINLDAARQFYMTARVDDDKADAQRAGRRWMAKPSRAELGLEDARADDAKAQQTSNDPFHWSKRIVWAYLARLRRSRVRADKALYAKWMADREAMKDGLLELVMPQFEHRYADRFDWKELRNGRKTVKSVCQHAAREWNPKRSRPVDHGVMAEEGYWRNAPELHRLNDEAFAAEVKRRREQSGKRSGKIKSARTVAAIADVVTEWLDKGRKIEPVEIAKFCKLSGICSVSTVYRQWDAVILYLRADSHSVVVKKIDTNIEAIKVVSADEPALPMDLPDPAERFWLLVGEPVLPWGGEIQLR